MAIVRSYKNKIKELLNNDLFIFESSVWLHSFSRSMVSIFIPILLLEMGYSISEVIFYYFIFNAIDVPLNFLARWTTRKIGARKVIILGSIFSIFFLVSLYQLEPNNWILLSTTALLAAVYDTFYWVAHLYLFMRCSKKDDNISSDTSLLSIIRGSAMIIAPILGAIILVSFGQNILILSSAIVLAFSIWPLFRIKNILDMPRRKQISFRKFFNTWEFFKDYLTKGFINVHLTTEGVIWPIFIFLFFGSFTSVSFLPVVATIGGGVFTYLAGRISKEKRRRAVVTGGLIIALIWISRLMINGSSAFYYLSVFVVGFFAPLIGIPLDSSIFEKGEKKEVLSTSMYRNITHMFSNAIIFGILSILVNIFNISFIMATASMFIAVFIYYFSNQINRVFLIKKKNKIKKKARYIFR